MSINFTTADLQSAADEYYYYAMSKAPKVSTDSIISKKNNSTNTEDVTLEELESANKCTDGKDDGKVGFFSAAGNIIKGAAKNAVSAVKGCFTDKNGNFSPLKTLSTVAMGAACVAFPAVGMVACGIGAVTGGASMAKGVMNALNATTDAEAKDAWEQVGAGGLTLATSVVGAKASFSAVKNSSTAGLASLDDAAAAIAKQEGKTSILSQLDDTATIGQKASALGKDMLSSTSNGLKNAKAAVGETLNTIKEKAPENPFKKKTTTAETGAETATAETTAAETAPKAEVTSETTPETTAAAETTPETTPETATTETTPKATSKAKEHRAKLKEAKENLKAAEKELKEVQKGDDDIIIGAAEDKYIAAKNAYKEVKNDTTFGEYKTKFTSKASDIASKSDTYQTLKNGKNVLTEGGAKEIISNIKKNLTTDNIKQIYQSLSSDGKKIYNYLENDSTKYAKAVQKYGYDNVLEVLEAFGGFKLADEAV